MSSALVPRTRPPPGLYRLARLFRRLSLVVLVGLLLFVASVGYSAVELVQSSAQNGGYSAVFAGNDTVLLQGSVSLSNPGVYPVSDFSLGLRIENASGTLLGDLSTSPVTLAAGATTTFPVRLSLPIRASGPALSLLVQDQFLSVGVWGNATYAYLFPVSVHFVQQKSWGAPFANLSITAGAPVSGGVGVSVPLTISFQNHADFTESGALDIALLSVGGATCGAGTVPLNVPPGYFYDTIATVALATGCSITGGSAVATFVSASGTVPLPPEGIP